MQLNLHPSYLGISRRFCSGGLAVKGLKETVDAEMFVEVLICNGV
jgi:hypothetical protein